MALLYPLDISIGILKQRSYMYIPSTAGKLAMKDARAGGAALKMSLGLLDVPPTIDGTLKFGKVVELRASGAEGPG